MNTKLSRLLEKRADECQLYECNNALSTLVLFVAEKDQAFHVKSKVQREDQDNSPVACDFQATRRLLPTEDVFVFFNTPCGPHCSAREQCER